MLSAAENMDLLRQHWAAQAARCEKPSVAWLVITEAGDVAGWSLAKRTAQKAARKRDAMCHVARLEPRDY